jgi:hypothetical protein
MRPASSFWTSFLAIVVLTLGAGCDSTENEASDTASPDASTSDGAGVASDVVGSEPMRREGELSDAEIIVRPATCGNGVCDPGREDCRTCPKDCGICKSCGDDVCDSKTENCQTCPQDCGACIWCGNGVCEKDLGEDCSSCGPDCGHCESCGDRVCDANRGESCFTCPDDCGDCPGCGDGTCRGNEDCASCSKDCGSCAVCGNGRCEPFETCINCVDDCGTCPSLGCAEMWACTQKCGDIIGNPPHFRASCLAACVALGCADVELLYDNIIRCAESAGDETATLCANQIAACNAAMCPSR